VTDPDNYQKYKEAIRPDFNALAYQPQGVDSETTVVWGKPGASPFQIQANVALEVDETRTETSRTFDVVRVKDPDNADNHVDMEVMTSYTSRKKNGGGRVTIDLARVQPSESVEILERDQTRSND
jgi:hypothetical protein